MAIPIASDSKRVKAFDFKLCAICQVSGITPLVDKPKEASFETLSNAVNRRSDEVSERLSPFLISEDFKLLRWHRLCYSTYTSENNIKRNESKSQKNQDTGLIVNDDESGRPILDNRRCTTRSLINKTDMLKCIFCQKVTKKKITTLYRVSEFPLAQKLLTISRHNQDSVFRRLSTCTSVNDIFATDVLYHDLCKKEYFRTSSAAVQDNSNIIESPIQNAFDLLILEIDTELQSKCFPLSFLASKLKQLCVDPDANVDNRLVKKLLIEHYGENILFSYPKDKSKSATVFKINIPLEDVVEQVRVSNQESVNSFLDSLRDEVKSYKFNLTGYVCDEANLKHELETFDFPKKWNIFFNKIFRPRHQLSNQTRRKLMSVFMDIYHIVNNGGLTPKHIALSETVHHVTRSKHLITLLNRLGHAISYKQLINIDTSIAAANLAKSENGLVPVPSNIARNKDLFLHGAMDNDDFNEETLDGKNTTHITAMVLYQTKTDKDDFSENDRISIKNIPNHTVGKNVCQMSCQKIKSFIPKLSVEEASKHVVSDGSVIDIEYGKYEKTDFLWVLCRVGHTISELVISPQTALCPGWTPFNQAISTSVLPVTNVAFCPMVPAPPTNQDCVYSAMKNFVNLNNQLNQEYQVLSCDMAIYLIAKKIQMQCNEFESLILRIGSFHLAKNWLSIIGSYLSGSGIADIFVETGLYGENTTQAVLRGTQYNRGVRAHKIMYEALRRLQLSIFLNEMQDDPTYTRSIELIRQLQESLMNKSEDTGALFDLLCEQSDELHGKFKSFLDEKCRTNDTFKFWTHYCYLVEILLNCIRAERDGLWDLHLVTVSAMLPYFFVYNHINYVRGCVMYVEDMKRLPQKIKTAFNQGHFSVKRRPGKFNNVAADHALEQTLIRSSKVVGGVIGITANCNAFQKWLILYPNKASISDMLFAFCGTIMDPTGDGEEYTHFEWGSNRLNRDEKDVQKLISFMRDHDDPFQNVVGQGLRNIVSGLVADDKVSDFLLTVEETGQNLCSEFITERLVQRKKGIFCPIKRNTVKSFSTMNATKKLPHIKSQIPIKNNDLTYIFFLAAQRSYSIENLVQHELLQYPPALATSEQLLRKPAKSLLVNEIVVDTKCVVYENLPESSSKQIHIIDGMALLQSTPVTVLNSFETVQDLGEFMLKRLCKLLKGEVVIQVDLVFDIYDKPSTKQCEQQRRQGAKEPLRYSIQGINSKIPKQWQRFLCVPENKRQLIIIISSYLLDRVVVPKRKLFTISGGSVNGESSMQKSCDGEIHEVLTLKCNHVEADTRIFFNTKQALLAHNTTAVVVVHSPDTDVFVLGIRFWKELGDIKCSALWIKIGTSKKQKYLGCHIASEAYGYHISSVLPAIHAFSGCDTTSKVGTKKAALKEAKSEENMALLEKLGKIELTDEDYVKYEALYLRIIKKKGLTCNESRFKIISTHPASLRNIASLPATSDSVKLHVLRSWAQVHVWNSALQADITQLNITNYGFYEDCSGLIRPALMTKTPLPEDLIPPCKCRKCNKHCPCYIREVPCCGYCNCIENSCKNKYN